MQHHRGLIALLVALSLGMAPMAHAQNLGSVIKGLFGGNSDNRQLRATIWVDPDGCEHWVMDGGIEGFMSSNLDRNGKPVCRSAPPVPPTCGTLESATMFNVGSASLQPGARKKLEDYFATIAGKDVVVEGHTDNSGSEKANLELSLRRATTVAKIARSQGVNAEARGYGEQVPIASNDTAEGRAKNRRVELTCS